MPKEKFGSVEVTTEEGSLWRRQTKVSYIATQTKDHSTLLKHEVITS